VPVLMPLQPAPASANHESIASRSNLRSNLTCPV
jgi:hypothetical protein